MSHRIAIVDDDVGVRTLLEAILGSRGWTVESYDSVTTALEGLTLRDAQAPDLLIVDVQLPDGCGLDLIGQVRDWTGRPVPAIVLSGLREERDMTRGFAAGALDFIGKPFRKDELLARCALHLARTAPSAEDFGPGLTVARVAADLQLPTVGGRVFGRYEPVRELGRGGQGCVLLARDAACGGRLVALKVLDFDLEAADLHRARFVRETYALQRVQHPGVVGIRDVGEFQGRLHYAMDYVEGVSLRERALERPLDATEALALARSLLSALQALEAAKVLHRDLKPANIVLRDGRVDRPVIIDFGLARGHHDRAITRPDLILGTPGFVAPEVIEGAEPDLRSDLFSLGVTLRFALVGEDLYPDLHGLPLLEAVAHRAVPIPDTTSGLQALLRGLLERDPRRRCASAAAALAALELVPADQRLPARAQGPTPPDDAPWWRDLASAFGLAPRVETIALDRAG